MSILAQHPALAGLALGLVLGAPLGALILYAAVLWLIDDEDHS